MSGHGTLVVKLQVIDAIFYDVWNTSPNNNSSVKAIIGNTVVTYSDKDTITGTMSLQDTIPGYNATKVDAVAQIYEDDGGTGPHRLYIFSGRNPSI